MDRPELLATLHIGHAQLRATIDALSDDELAGPAHGDWTRRDFVAHIEWWERNSAHVVASLRAGRDPYPTDEPFDLDARNARTLEERRGRTADDVRSGEAAAWADLVPPIEGGPARARSPCMHRRRASRRDDPRDTDRHRAEHLPHLRLASDDEIADAGGGAS